MFPLSISLTLSIFITLVGIATAIPVAIPLNSALLGPNRPPLRRRVGWNPLWGLGPVIPSHALPPLLDVDLKEIDQPETIQPSL